MIIYICIRASELYRDSHTGAITSDTIAGRPYARSPQSRFVHRCNHMRAGRARWMTTYLDLWLCVVIHTNCFLDDVAPAQCWRYRPKRCRTHVLAFDALAVELGASPSLSMRSLRVSRDTIRNPSGRFINLGLLSEPPLRNTSSYHWYIFCDTDFDGADDIVDFNQLCENTMTHPMAILCQWLPCFLISLKMV